MISNWQEFDPVKCKNEYPCYHRRVGDTLEMCLELPTTEKDQYMDFITEAGLEIDYNKLIPGAEVSDVINVYKVDVQTLITLAEGFWQTLWFFIRGKDIHKFVTSRELGYFPEHLGPPPEFLNPRFVKRLERVTIPVKEKK